MVMMMASTLELWPRLGISCCKVFEMNMTRANAKPKTRWIGSKTRSHSILIDNTQVCR
jgi:hypothetical protein